MQTTTKTAAADVPLITLAEFGRVVERAVRTGRPAVVLGPPGVGKTQAVSEIASEAGYGVVVFNAANALPFDLLGQPLAVPGREPRTVLAEPTWLGEIRATGRDRGVLVIDELATAPIESAPAFSQLLGERRCGPHHLPDGWTVVALGNEVADRAGARPLLAHIVNRCAVYRVRPDIESWVAWARRQRGPAVTRWVPASLIAFVRSSEFVPWLDRMAPRGVNEPWLSFRSLTYAVQDLAATVWDGKTSLDDLALPTGRDAVTVLSARVPTEVAHLFATQLAVGSELPTWDDVVHRPADAVVPSTPLGGVHLVEFLLARTATLDRDAAFAAIESVFTYLGRTPGAVAAQTAFAWLKWRFGPTAQRPPFVTSSLFERLVRPIVDANRAMHDPGIEL